MTPRRPHVIPGLAAHGTVPDSAAATLGPLSCLADPGNLPLTLATGHPDLKEGLLSWQGKMAPLPVLCDLWAALQRLSTGVSSGLLKGLACKTRSSGFSPPAGASLGFVNTSDSVLPTIYLLTSKAGRHV